MSVEAIIGAAGLFLTILTTGGLIAFRIGRLDAKVDALAQAIADESTARIALLTALTARVENLSRQFGDHAIQDAAHFGEIKGILGQPSQVVGRPR